MSELFSVVQFFANDTYEEALDAVPPQRALSHASFLATSVGAKLGTTRRVIVQDVDKCVVWEWEYGNGLVFPPLPEVPPELQANRHEHDCTECGRHFIQFVSPPDPPRCAACVCVPGWYHHAAVAKIIDPDHQRTV